jgi:hypothetical protein
VTVVVLDADVVSALLCPKLAEPIGRQLLGQVPAVTFVTIGELTKWTLVRRWGPRSVERCAPSSTACSSSPTTPGWRPAGANCRPTPRCVADPAPANDTWIAACCLVRELPLATFNTKDFVDFAEHEGLRLLS